ncbi:MAG: peptidoglycan editing factor PgeF [Bacteroidia bacterium]|nr:peptidoglycan editing factor PgeF [Bacteroidia bacterium]
MFEYPLTLIRSSLLSQFPNIEFAMSTRQGEAPDAPFGFNLGYELGDADERVTGNIARFAEALGLDAGDLAVMKQVHGDTIRDVAEPGLYDASDALVCTQPRVGITVRVADCAPVILYAPDVQAVAVAHAGWRGTAEHITAKLLAHLIEQKHADPAGIFAYIGPCAGKEHYEVGPEVAALFPATYVDSSGDRPRIDLKGLNAQQLEHAGIPSANIEIDELCTIRDRALFHSWRRDGERSGRMLATIYLKDSIE